MRIVQIALVAGLSVLSALASAHGGGLDANGCHHVRKTGEYHCHQSNNVIVAARSAHPRLEELIEPMAYVCGSKQYCRQMMSCDEAKFYLDVCGLSRLDGNSDGVPCENLCATQ